MDTTSPYGEDDPPEDQMAATEEDLYAELDAMEPVELEPVGPEQADEPPADWEEPAGPDARVYGAGLLGMSIAGFTVVDYGDPHLGAYSVPGTDVTLSLRREIAPLLLAYAAWFHKAVEPLVKGQCWGHAYRPVRGSTNPSYHSAGIAIDLNSARHQLGRRGTFTAAQAARIRVMCRAMGLRTGMDYVRRADEMHVEIIVPRSEALALVTRLQTPPDAPRPAVKPGVKPKPPTRVAVSLTGAIASFRVHGRNGHDVLPIQRALTAERFYRGALDAIPGPKTIAAYAAWQRHLGYSGKGADGVPGSKSLTRLGAGHGFVVTG